MSACAKPIIREAVAVVKGHMPKQPRLTFEHIKRRLLVEAHKRSKACVGSKRPLETAAANLCTSDWCGIFLDLVDKPQYLQQDGVIETLWITMDRLERGENVTVKEVYEQNREVFKKL